MLKTVRGRWYKQTVTTNAPAVELESDTVSDDDLQLGADGFPGEVGFEIDPEFAKSLEDEWQAILRGAKTYSQEEVDALIWRRYK